MDKSMIFLFTSRIHIPHYLRNLPFLLWISWFIIFNGVNMISFLVWLLVEGASVFGTIFGVVSLLITSVALNIGMISSEFLLSFYDDGPSFCCDGGSPSSCSFFSCKLWELDLQLLPSSLFLLRVKILLVHILLRVCWKRSSSFLHNSLEWMSPII